MHTTAPISRQLVDKRFTTKLIAAVVTFALLSVGISVGGKWLGRAIVLAGHTEDRTSREIVIGNNVLLVPSNAIRFPEARIDGVTDRLDLYLHWPDLDGYSAGQRDAFNNGGKEKSIVFLTFEEASMSRDMSGRLEPIYSHVIEPQGRKLGGGLVAHTFTAASGYRDEELVVGSGAAPFVARCLTEKAAADSLAPCERDIRIGEELSLSYRFPRALLAQGAKLDAAVRARAQALLRTPG